MTNLLELKSIAVNERGRNNQARFSYQLTGEGIVPTAAITGTIEIIVPWTGDLAAAQKQVRDYLPLLPYSFGDHKEDGMVKLNTVAFNERGHDNQARFCYQISELLSLTEPILIAGNIQIVASWTGDLAITQKEVDDHLRHFAREFPSP